MRRCRTPGAPQGGGLSADLTPLALAVLLYFNVNVASLLSLEQAVSLTRFWTLSPPFLRQGLCILEVSFLEIAPALFNSKREVSPLLPPVRAALSLLAVDG